MQVQQPISDAVVRLRPSRATQVSEADIHQLQISNNQIHMIKHSHSKTASLSSPL